MDLYGYAGMFRANVPARYRQAAVSVAAKAPRGTTWFRNPPVVVAPKMPRGWVGFPSAGPIVGLEGWDPISFVSEHPVIALAVVGGAFMLLKRKRRK